MTTLDLSTYPDSNSVAEWCAAAGHPEWEIFARATLDSNGINQTAVAIAASGASVEDFTAFSEFMRGHPALLKMLDGALHKTLWWQYAPRITGMSAVPRGGQSGLFAWPDFEYPGGILAKIIPLDEVYRLPTLAQLRALLAHWRTPYAYAADGNDCDDFAAQMRGAIKHLPPSQRPALGEAGISCQFDGGSYLHRLGIAPTSDAGLRWVDNDGQDYPMGRDAGPYSSIVVENGVL